FVRALTYFYLVNLYGAVPLVLATDYTHTALEPRSPAAAVYAQIRADLEAARGNLFADYPQAGNSPTDRTRPNLATATALLARVCLYTGDWVRADSAATALLNDPAYRLEPNLDSVFRSGSRETIWALQPVFGNIATAEGSFFIPSAANIPPAYPLTNILLGSFEPGDQRRMHWTANAANGQRYAYKYKQRFNTPPNGEFDVVIRLAELYLVRAEARAMQGNADGALADINAVRQRAGLPGLDAGVSNANLLTAIRHERQIEFFAEWGNRWLDLKRTGQANAILGAEKSRWTGTDTLYPLPAGELTSNPNLVQNPGY
ncbi:MAG TPA: RagB/SusD family nutrient uptake outer membrane protein, partial [Puia sp.]|nr:RagB/SusD family nutrient uptake outer membrane protein [Puia sp.]